MRSLSKSFALVYSVPSKCESRAQTVGTYAELFAMVTLQLVALRASRALRMLRPLRVNVAQKRARCVGCIHTTKHAKTGLLFPLFLQHSLTPSELHFAIILCSLSAVVW